jgi:hypothetical protein
MRPPEAVPEVSGQDPTGHRLQPVGVAQVAVMLRQIVGRINNSPLLPAGTVGCKVVGFTTEFALMATVPANTKRDGSLSPA